MAYYDDSRWPAIKAPELYQARYNELPVEITSYKDALAWWDRRASDAWAGSGDRPVGKRDHNYRRMRKRADGSIEMDYNNHILCVWHPDNSITVNPWSTYASGPFERFVMPRKLSVRSSAQCGKIVYMLPDDNVEWRLTMETDAGTKRQSNPEILVCRAENPVNFVYNDETEMWEPANEYKCKPFQWLEIDRSSLREVSIKYNMPEFLSAITAALAMGADIETAKRHSELNAQSATLPTGEDILTLLEQNRFVEAASLVRPRETRTYDVATGKWTSEKEGLNSTDVKKIRHLAYHELGILYIESARIVTLPQLGNIENKIRDFGQV